MGSFSIVHWLIVALVVVLVFGTSKLKNAGSDLGKAIKGFKDGMRGEEEKPGTGADNKTIDVDAKEKGK